MVITGSSTYIYELYHQSGLSAKFLTDSMKDFSLRLLTNSGGNYYQDIVFSSGKVFAGNSQTTGGMNFVGGYKKDSPFDFEIRYETGKYAFYVGGDIKMAGKQILNSQTVQGSNIKPTITGFQFSGGSQNLTGSFEIYGSRPSLYFSPLYQYNYPSQTGLYSGYVLINGLPGKLNSISSDSAAQYLIPSTAFTSGGYVISGLNFASGSEINAQFDFNFGSINTGLSFYIPQTGVAGDFINISMASAGIIYSGLPNPVQYQDFVATYSAANPINLQPSVEFLYRSGDVLVSGTGMMTGNLYGYISGSGYISGNGTGYTINGTYNQRGVDLTWGGFSRQHTGEMREFVYGTGQVTYDYSVLAVGREYSYFYTTIDQTTGRLTGTLTGAIYNGSGYYTFQQYITGRPQFWSGSYQTGNQAIGEYYNNGSPSSAESYYNNDYESENYTGYINHTVYWTGFVSMQKTQGFTGDYTTGIYSTSAGTIASFNLFTGDASLLTGDYSFVTGNYYNYTLNGNVSGPSLVKSPVQYPAGVGQIGMRVTHDRDLARELIDYFKFSLSDGTNTILYTGQAFYV